MPTTTRRTGFSLTLWLCLFILLAMAAAGCAPQKPRIDVQADPALAAGAFGSWNFVSPLAIEEAGYPADMIDAFKRAVDDAMNARGYRRSDDPELLVNVAALIAGEGDASITSDAYQAIHPQRGTFHNSWRGYGEGFGASTRQQRYGDGSISIGIIGSQDLELLWEGVASGRLSGKRSAAELEAMIDSVTHQVLAEMPRGSG